MLKTSIRLLNPKKEIKSLFRDTLNIVFAGNIGVAQSFDTIIDAAIILKKTLSNFTFIIIGDGRDKKRVVDRINKLSLSDNFIFWDHTLQLICLISLLVQMHFWYP